MAYLKFALPIKGSGGLFEVFYLMNPAIFNIPGAELYLIDVSDDDGAIMAVPIWRVTASSSAIFKRMRSTLRHLGVNRPGKGGLICRINKDSYVRERKIFYHGDKPKMMEAGVVQLDIIGPLPVLPNHNNCLRISVDETTGLPDVGRGLDTAVFGHPNWVPQL
jgi:hypothetical protein